MFATRLSASGIWFGDKDGLHQIDPAANRVVSSVAFEPPVAIATNALDGSVWALTQSRLARLDGQGVVQVQSALRDLGGGIGAPRLLALNPNDASVWAAFENRLLHFAANGALQQNLAIAAQDLAIAQDGRVWVLSQASLQQLDSAGAIVQSVPLTAAMRSMKFIALDDTGNAIWLAGAKDLLRLSSSDPSQTLRTLSAPETTSAISFDLQTGTLWVLGQNTLSSFHRDGTPGVSRDLRDFSISNPQTLVFDFTSRAAWVGHQHGISRIAVDGSLAASFPATPSVQAIAIGRSPLHIQPVITLQSPPDGGLLNDPTPLFRVAYDALCGSASCGFPPSFFSSFSLSASLDGTDVSASFVFDPATGSASFRPGSRLAEGFHVFSAQARDSFGGVSNTVSASFTIDTVAPVFQNVAPPSGSVFKTTSSVTITGSVDDATASVALGAQTQGASFSFVVTLNEGVNNFTLVARDPAGNSASYPLTYTYSPPKNIPPTVSMTSPISGTPYSAPASIFVSAKAQDSDGTIARVEFLLDGGVAATITASPYETTLTSVPAGNHTLAARAVDDRGAMTTSAGVTVPVTASSITITSPAPNAVIAGDNVLVTGHIVALANSGVNVNDSVAAVDTGGNYAVLISLAPGTNTITAKLGTPDGNVLTQSISVLAAGAQSPFGVVADPLIGISPLSVTFTVTNPTSSAALVSSNIFGTFILPAQTTAQGSLSLPAGVFAASFTFSGAVGTFSNTLVIDSRDAAQMDQVFRSLWNGLNNALVAGDKPTAMRYLNGAAQQKFGPVFDVLMPFMSEIVASYSTLAQTSITADIGSYAVVRFDNGTKRLYFIYFVRDPDGVWRIDEM